MVIYVVTTLLIGLFCVVSMGIWYVGRYIDEKMRMEKKGESGKNPPFGSA